MTTGGQTRRKKKKKSTKHTQPSLFFFFSFSFFLSQFFFLQFFSVPKLESKLESGENAPRSLKAKKKKGSQAQQTKSGAFFFGN
jgi:hypothetical protein